MEYHNNRLIVNFKHQINNIRSLLFLFVLVILGIVWFSFETIMTITLVIGFFIDAIPSLFLHFQYLRKNKGEEYKVLFDRIIQNKNGEQTEYLVSEMMLINIMLPPALYKKSSTQFLGIEAYYFACVYLKNGEKLILTSLLHPKLDDILHQLKGVPIKRKSRLFNPLQWNYL